MSSSDKREWAQTVINIALTLFLALGGYWVNKMDQRNTAQDTQIDDHAYRIRSNEKDLEYAKKQLEKIDSIDKKLDTVIEEVRK